MANFNPNKAALLQPKAVSSAAKVGPLGGLLGILSGGEELYNSNFNPRVMSQNIETSRQMLEPQASGFNPTATQRTAAGAEMKAIADRAVGRAKSEVEAAPEKYKEGLAQGKYPLNLMNPRGPKTPEVQEAPSAPTEVETQRQVLEQGAKEQLRTNQLSRPQAAEAVVEADIARTGEELTPDQRKARVAEESAAMKTMDNDQLSKYLSYALIGAGLLAAGLDKSGESGRAFAGGFNAQLDRELQGGLAQREMDAQAAKAAQDAALEERKIDITERDVASKEASRSAKTTIDSARVEGLLDKWQKDAQIAQGKLDAYRDRTAAQAAKGSSDRTPTAPALSYKDNKELVEGFFKATDQKADKGVVEAAASQLGNLQKNYPDLTVDEQMELILDQFQIKPSKEAAWWDFTGLTASPQRLSIR